MTPRNVLLKNILTVIDMIQHNHSVVSIAQYFRVPHMATRLFIKRLDLPQQTAPADEYFADGSPSLLPASCAIEKVTRFGHAYLSAASQERLAQIIDMRERGITLEAIGQQFSITRERIRQILRDAGRDDLRNVGAQLEAGARRRAKMPTKPCAECGNPIRDTASNSTKRFCSSACRVSWRLKNNFYYQHREQIVAMRRQNISWAKIAAALGRGERTIRGTTFRNMTYRIKEHMGVPEHELFFDSRLGHRKPQCVAAEQRQTERGV